MESDPETAKNNSLRFRFWDNYLFHSNPTIDVITIDVIVGNPNDFFDKHCTYRKIQFDENRGQWKCPPILDFINDRMGQEYEYFDSLDDVKTFLCENLNLEIFQDVLTLETISLNSTIFDQLIPILFENEPIGSYIISFAYNYLEKVIIKSGQDKFIVLNLPEIRNSYSEITNSYSRYIPDPLDLCKLEKGTIFGLSTLEDKKTIQQVKEESGFKAVTSMIDFSRLGYHPKEKRDKYIDIFPEEKKSEIVNVMLSTHCPDLNLLNLALKFAFSCPKFQNFIFPLTACKRLNCNDANVAREEIITFMKTLETIKSSQDIERYYTILSQILSPLLHLNYFCSYKAKKKLNPEKYNETTPFYLSTTRSDMSFVVQGKHIPVHGIIIAMRAPGFKNVMDDKWSESSKNEIHLSDVVSFYSYSTVSRATQFIYQGKITDLSFEEAIPLFQLAHCWQCEGLISYCETFLLDCFEIENPNHKTTFENIHQIISNDLVWGQFSMVTQITFNKKIAKLLPEAFKLFDVEENDKRILLDQLLKNWTKLLNDEIAWVLKDRADEMTKYRAWEQMNTHQ